MDSSKVSARIVNPVLRLHWGLCASDSFIDSSSCTNTSYTPSERANHVVVGYNNSATKTQAVNTKAYMVASPLGLEVCVVW